MRQFNLLDFLFIFALGLIFVPIFRFNLDIGFFVSGICLLGGVIFNVNKKGGEDK